MFLNFKNKNLPLLLGAIILLFFTFFLLVTAAGIDEGFQGGQNSGVDVNAGNYFNNSAPNALSSALKGISTLLFVALFTALAALTFLGVAITLIIRYIYLTFLLILSPIIWLAWIFPHTKQWWGWWWRKLFHWLLFAPLVLFFLYLTIYVVNAYPNIFSEVAKDSLKNQSLAIDLSYLSSLVMIIGLLVGGLILANKLGTVGSKAAFGAAQGLVKGVEAWGRKLPVKTGAWAIRKTNLSRAAPDLGKQLNEQLKKGGRISQWFGKKADNFGSAIERLATQKPPSLYASAISGMKKGSGLFKKTWRCSVCGYLWPQASANAPKGPCPNPQGIPNHGSNAWV